MTSEINAAFLWAQLQAADEITARRFVVWDSYYERFGPLEVEGRLRRPIVPDHCEHNAHLFYLLVDDRETRDGMISHLRRAGVQAVFHYVPLHSSPAGRRYGRTPGELNVTDEISERLIRLPLWVGMDSKEIDRVVAGVRASLN